MNTQISKNPNNLDYNEFDIYELLVKPFDNIKCKDTAKPFGSSGWYITIKFSIKLTSDAHKRFIKHIDPEHYSFYLDYIENTNIFTYKEAVTKTPTTCGALEELNQLKQKNLNPHYRFNATSYLYRCIETLSLFWV